jgi:tRNA(Ile2) C34 agmatinyltransferase TiaS
VEQSTGLVQLLISSVLLVGTMISIWVVAVQAVAIRKLLEVIAYRSTEAPPSSEWKCPKCEHMNSGAAFKCSSCGYSLT